MDFQPKKLEDYIGQEHIKKSIRVSLKASKKRKESFPHVLLHGASGLGKTTLAYVIANEFKSRCITLLAPVLDSHEPMYEAMIKCKKGDFLFIDEVHALPRVLQETLYNAMTSQEIQRKDHWGREITVKLKSFTCMSATTELGELAPPFRERFGFIIPLERYSQEEIEQIIAINVNKLKYKITASALTDLARASRLNPRTGNRLLERCHDTATVENTKNLDEKIVSETLSNLQVDRNGLTTSDIKILNALAFRFKFKPTGLRTLALSVFIDEKAIESSYEPWLTELNLIERTSRGRIITKEGVQYLAKNYS